MPFMPTTKVESEIQGRKKKEIICKVFPSNEDSPQSKKEKKKTFGVREDILTSGFLFDSFDKGYSCSQSTGTWKCGQRVRAGWEAGAQRGTSHRDRKGFLERRGPTDRSMSPWLQQTASASCLLFSSAREETHNFSILS